MTSVNRQQGIMLDQFQPWSVKPYGGISYSTVNLQRQALIHGVIQEARSKIILITRKMIE